MAELWFGALALSLVFFVVLDGFDFGVGMLSLFVARTDAERRTAIAAIGPFWDGNEVWLIAAGGVLFVAFPSLLATAFPAFYLALFVVLWGLALRGIALEVRSHVADPLWRAFWDAVFALSSSLLALLFGIALGNVVRGVPLRPGEPLTLAFFTTFTPFGDVGLVDYYTLSVGVLAVAVLSAHGAAFLAFRTEGLLRERARNVMRSLWIASGALFALVTVETLLIRPELFTAFGTRALPWAFALAAVSGAVLAARAYRQNEDFRVFAGSTLALGGVLATTAALLYPTLLRSTLVPAASLDASSVLAPPYGLRVATVWWPAAFLLAVGYLVFAFRVNREKLRPNAD